MKENTEKKRIVIVTNSTNYEPRAEKVGEFFLKQGYHVLWIESDFVHREKKKRFAERKGHFYVDTITYKKNLSVRRLYSHYDFAQRVYHLLKKQRVDLLYIMIPANSLAPVAARLKSKQHFKLIIDIIDLWPESLPIKKLKWIWPIQYWGRLRDAYLDKADFVLTECDLYRTLLRLDVVNTATLYWPKEQTAPNLTPHKIDDCLHIAYLGSINYIIDIDMIIDILSEIKQLKIVKFHVIGDGESREELLNKLRENCIDTQYYGIVYNEEEKKKIFEKCSFGMNIMKEGICVGLTMKSIDYFCYGIPLINNIHGDTWSLVEEYDIGINCKREDYKGCAQRIVEAADKLQERRDLIQRLYNQLFSIEALERVLAGSILPLLERKE